ncbi:hypothetical protein MLD38_012613 [Melastoma candidum]|uniref:Uncharacterized protein n=1 Tax=Melastoma candidum TaxID=119954 RepID=A0ACB9R6B5_9MYRT|nr:hypothetical protein MLD38_012613 [Melastoma candidum]
MKSESSSSGQSKQGAAPPCAACKLLRRRCAGGCIFSPHFPSDQPQKFAIVHKVFGASNVSKMLQLPEHLRSDAVSSMVYEGQRKLALAEAEVVQLRMNDQFNPSTSLTDAVTSTSPRQGVLPVGHDGSK